MKKTILLLISFSVAFTINWLSAKKKYTYVGVDNCKQCHNEQSILYQYSIWATSPHANAYKRLSTRKAKIIAESFSISSPSTNKKCLKCHTTGGGKNEITKTEGVGCESCHGPGSGYSEVSNHVDLKSRRNGYAKAKKFGMYPILKYEDNLKNREKLCRHCHNTQRYCWPKSIKDIRRQKIYIQVIDKLIKGDINFYHSIRRY